ncbi:autoinducer binding domain-containing protein [Phaeovulum sp.]|uniref:autoinducer binding domain-containing protein n=1 Tax=Phaeovulum sp. TaxID=2934796 RepID=UPI0039E3B1E8
MKNHPEKDVILQRLAQMCDSGYALALHIRYTRPTFMYSTYANGWMEHYSARGMMLSDPVVRWGLTNTGYIRWDNIELPDPDHVIAEAARFGIHNGLTCAVGPARSRSISGFSRSTSSFDAAEAQELLALTEKLHILTDTTEQATALQ